MTESQIPPQCMPQPIPVAIGVATTDGAAGDRLVVLTVLDATGQKIVFLDPQTAESVGGQIRAAGKQAKTGLVTPVGSGLIVPGRDG